MNNDINDTIVKSRALSEIDSNGISGNNNEKIIPGTEEALIESLRRELAEKDEEIEEASEEIKIKDEELKNKKKNKKNIKGKKGKKSSNNEDIIEFLIMALDVIKYAVPPLLCFGILTVLNFFTGNMYLYILVYILFSVLLTLYYQKFYKLKSKKDLYIPLNILDKISEGKLNINFIENRRLRKELGDFAEPLDKVIKKMSDMVTKVELSAMDLAGNSDALSYFATSMANKTDQESESINKIDISAKELNIAMQYIKTNVESAYNISKDSIKEADNSSLEILSLIEEMNTINEMSDKILATMNFIDEIAEETNLLALNAAIQASHAGEEGKGFSVVAAEIKSLADSSSQATKAIYDIIERTVESIAKGVKVSESAKKALEKIVSLIKSTEDIMSDINISINEQSKITHGLKESLENIQHLTGDINKDTKNMKSAIESLSGQAQILKQLISLFELSGEHRINTDDIFGVE